MIPIISSFTYSIVFYEGSYSSGSLYVTSHYKDLSQIVKLSQVSVNWRASLPTTNLENKYFYLRKSALYEFSNYIDICFEDNNFDLSYSNIKYCCTNINPFNNPDDAIKGCSFIPISYYKTQGSSSTKKYYFMIPFSKSFNYSIVFYEGSYSSGRLYVTCDYKSISNDDNKGLSKATFIYISVGPIIFTAIVIIIIYCYCSCCKKNKIGFISPIQPNYEVPNYFE